MIAYTWDEVGDQIIKWDLPDVEEQANEAATTKALDRAIAELIDPKYPEVATSNFTDYFIAGNGTVITTGYINDGKHDTALAWNTKDHLLAKEAITAYRIKITPEDEDEDDQPVPNSDQELADLIAADLRGHFGDGVRVDTRPCQTKVRSWAPSATRSRGRGGELVWIMDGLNMEVIMPTGVFEITVVKREIRP